jgi:MarR family 2-MHQ and catechol resistance regulon transcriptional repressor
VDQDSAIHVWRILFKAAHSVERNALDSIAGLDLCLSDFAVLELLLHKGPQPVNQIGKRVFLSSGSITAAVDRLEDRHLVHRSIDPGDLRSRIVTLTASGRTFIEQAFAKHAEDMEQTMAVLRPRERQELIRLLKKLGLWAAARAER